MTKKEINLGLAAIITTVAETETAPEGIMYAALMGHYSLEEFTDLITLLKRAGILLGIGPHEVTISAEGRALAAKINASHAVQS